MKKAAWLFFIALLVSVSIQAKQPQQAAIMATTDDGRRVVLLPDGKWQFVETAPAPATPAATPAPAKTSSSKEEVWKEVTAYFAGWKIETLDQNSGIIKTDWRNFGSGGFQAKVDVAITDTGMNYNIQYRSCDTAYGCNPADPDIAATLRKNAEKQIFAMSKKALLLDADFMDKLESDMKNFKTEYQPK